MNLRFIQNNLLFDKKDNISKKNLIQISNLFKTLYLHHKLNETEQQNERFT